MLYRTPTCNERLLNNQKARMLPHESVPKRLRWLADALWERTYRGWRDGSATASSGAEAWRQSLALTQWLTVTCNSSQTFILCHKEPGFHNVLLCAKHEDHTQRNLDSFSRHSRLQDIIRLFALHVLQRYLTRIIFLLWSQETWQDFGTFSTGWQIKAQKSDQHSTIHLTRSKDSLSLDSGAVIYYAHTSPSTRPCTVLTGVQFTCGAKERSKHSTKLPTFPYWDRALSMEIILRVPGIDCIMYVACASTSQVLSTVKYHLWPGSDTLVRRGSIIIRYWEFTKRNRFVSRGITKHSYCETE